VRSALHVPVAGTHALPLQAKPDWQSPSTAQRVLHAPVVLSQTKPPVHALAFGDPQLPAPSHLPAE